MRTKKWKLFAVMALFLGGVGGTALAPASATAGEDHKDLNLYTMPRTVTSCGSCEHFRSGSGPTFDCFSCGDDCNCLVEGFTAPDGRKYDGKFYPGVVRRK